MVCENCPSRDSCEKRSLGTAEASAIMATMFERVRVNQMSETEYSEVERYIMGRIDLADVRVLSGLIKRSFHK